MYTLCVLVSRHDAQSQVCFVVYHLHDVQHPCVHYHCTQTKDIHDSRISKNFDGPSVKSNSGRVFLIGGLHLFVSQPIQNRGRSVGRTILGTMRKTPSPVSLWPDSIWRSFWSLCFLLLIVLCPCVGLFLNSVCFFIKMLIIQTLVTHFNDSLK